MRPRLLPGSFLEMAICAELFAWLTEAAYLMLFGLRVQRALLLSLGANGASLTLGLVSRALFGAP